MLTVQIDNRDGLMWELPAVDITYKTSRYGKASSFEFIFLQGGFYQASEFKINPGDIVRAEEGGTPLFYGYVFTIDGGRDEGVKVTAYDQLRYLTNKDTYVFKNTSVEAIIQKLAADTGLRVGTLAKTGYSIPSMLEDGSGLLDIICHALDKTLQATGKIFVFYDDFGSLALRDAADWKLDISIGDTSLAYDYKLKRSIDSDTYNRVKLVRDNKDTGRRDVYIAQDSSTIAKWGRLQYYEKVDDSLNSAQIQQALNTIIALKNRELQTFSIDAIGDTRIRAGCSISVNMEQTGIQNYFLVEECTHKFDGADHTMSLELKYYG